MTNDEVYELGYRSGKNAANADFYAQGYQDAFSSLRHQIEALLAQRAEQPIPARKTSIPNIEKPVPIEARLTIQLAIWELIQAGDNEWTTWTDSSILAEAVAQTLTRTGYKVIYEP